MKVFRCDINKSLFLFTRSSGAANVSANELRGMAGARDTISLISSTSGTTRLYTAIAKIDDRINILA
jgi:hypothetical protein